MPKMETKFKLVSKRLFADCKVQEDQKNSDIQNTQVRNPLMFKEKIIKKMREGYKTKMKESIKQWKSKFTSFIKVRLQSYDQNCSSSSEFICPICLQMYMTPCPTSCGHIFCFRCIDQSIIRNSSCPTCRNFIRADQFIESKAFSELNHHFWMQSKERDSYLQKYQKNVQWLNQRLIDKSKIQAHDLIDVKDTQYIWCKAHVLCVYKGIDKTQVLVHFQGWNQIYNEVLNVNSQRIAPRNFFSEREDIPRYRLSSPEDNMRSRIEYRDYRDRNLNINANINANLSANNQIESEEESNNQASNLRPLLNFRNNRHNPLTIRFNTRQGRDSIFAIRSLIQPYLLRNLRPRNQEAEQNEHVNEEHEEQEEEEEEENGFEIEEEQSSEVEEEEVEEQQENENENENENQQSFSGQFQFQQPMEQNMFLDAQFDSREEHPFMRSRLNQEIQQDNSDSQWIREQSRLHQQLNNTPISNNFNQGQQMIGRDQERNNFDRGSISNNSFGFDYSDSADQNLQNRQNSQINSVSEYIQLIDGNKNEIQLIRDRFLVNQTQKRQQNEQKQRDEQSEKEQKENSQSNESQKIRIKKSKMIQKTQVQQPRTTKIRRNRIRARARRHITEQPPINLSQKSFSKNK